MSILKRAKRFWLAHCSNKPNETELGLDMLIADIDEHLAEARGELAFCESEERRFSSMMLESQRIADEMERLARQALALGKESLAREAIKRRLLAQMHGKRYMRMLAQQQEDIAKLSMTLEDLQAKRDEIKERQQQLTLRRHLAHARRSIAESLYGEQGRVPLEHAEESALNDEFMADAYRQLAEGGMGPSSGTESMLTTEMIETALRELRGTMNLPAISQEKPKEGNT